MSRAARGRRLLSAVNLVALALLFVIENLIGERHWFTTLVTYAPQQPLVAPTLFLLLWSLLARDLIGISRNVAALGVCLLLNGVCLGLFAAPRGDRLLPRVLTWNIHHGSGNFAAVAAEIRRLEPDIVCLQEVYPYDLSRLRPHLPEYRFVGAGDAVIGTRHMLRGYTVRRYGIPMATSRLLLRATIRLGDQDVTVLCTHFATAAHGSNLRRRGIRDHLRNTADARQKQVDILLAEVERIEGPRIVCGDFNTPPRGRIYRQLLSRLNDAFQAAGVGIGPTYSTSRPALRIDYIFTAGGIDPTHAEVIDTKASDHFPVLAEIALPKR